MLTQLPRTLTLVYLFAPSSAGRGPSGPLGFRGISRGGRSALRSAGRGPSYSKPSISHQEPWCYLLRLRRRRSHPLTWLSSGGPTPAGPPLRAGVRPCGPLVADRSIPNHRSRAQRLGAPHLPRAKRLGTTQRSRTKNLGTTLPTSRQEPRRTLSTSLQNASRRRVQGRTPARANARKAKRAGWPAPGA